MSLLNHCKVNEKRRLQIGFKTIFKTALPAKSWFSSGFMDWYNSIILWSHQNQHHKKRYKNAWSHWKLYSVQPRMDDAKTIGSVHRLFHRKSHVGCNVSSLYSNKSFSVTLCLQAWKFGISEEEALKFTVHDLILCFHLFAFGMHCCKAHEWAKGNVDTEGCR